MKIKLKEKIVIKAEEMPRKFNTRKRVSPSSQAYLIIKKNSDLAKDAFFYDDSSGTVEVFGYYDTQYGTVSVEEDGIIGVKGDLTNLIVRGDYDVLLKLVETYYTIDKTTSNGHINIRSVDHLKSLTAVSSTSLDYDVIQDVGGVFVSPNQVFGWKLEGRHAIPVYDSNGNIVKKDRKGLSSARFINGIVPTNLTASQIFLKGMFGNIVVPTGLTATHLFSMSRNSRAGGKAVGVYFEAPINTSILSFADSSLEYLVLQDGSTVKEIRFDTLQTYSDVSYILIPPQSNPVNFVTTTEPL